MAVNPRVMDIPNLPMAGLRGDLRSNEPLSAYTSWRVGGPADRLYWPADLEDLLTFLRFLPEQEPLFWLGLGSNLLIRDGGLRGTVVCTRGRLKTMRCQEGQRIYVEAGVPCAHVAKFCAEQRLTGAEFLAGIPGTMGGALAMNAGAFGGETWPLVRAVIMTDRHGRTRRRDPHQFSVGYRSVSGFEGEWFVAAELQLQAGDPAASRERIRLLLNRRANTQPTHQPSCGSVFRNPEGDHAARLIEACGLKGYCIGGACVSEKHANFIVNTGTASASDLESLIFYVRDEVERIQGIRLVPEVRMVGEPAKSVREGM